MKYTKINDLDFITNKIIFQVNPNKFSNLYEVYALKTDEKKFSFNSFVLDPKSCFPQDVIKCIYGNLYTTAYSGRTVLFMMKRSTFGNKNLLKKIVDQSVANGGPAIKIEPVDIKALQSSPILGQLMINTLPHWGDESEFACSNLTGKFIVLIEVLNPDPEKDRFSQAKKLVTLQIHLSKNMELSAHVCTYSSIADLTHDQRRALLFKNNRNPNSYPQVRLIGKKNTLVRIPPDECITIKKNEHNTSDLAENTYIRRRVGRDKSQVSFLDVDGYDERHKSKLYALASVVEEFNKRYRDVLDTEMQFVPGNVNANERYIAESYKDRMNDLRKKCAEALLGRTLNIIKTDSTPQIEAIADSLAIMYKLPIGPAKGEKTILLNNTKVSSEEDKESLNIAIIYPSWYYRKKKEDDAYNKNYNVPIQHITTHNKGFGNLLPNNCETKLRSCKDVMFVSLLEILMKEAIIKGNINEFCKQFIDVEKLKGFSFVWNKWIRDKKEIKQQMGDNSQKAPKKIPKLFRLDVLEDCSFAFSGLHSSDSEENQRLYDLFIANDGTYDGLEYIIIEPSKRLNCVHRSTLRILAHADAIEERLEEIEAKREEKKISGSKEKLKIGWQNREALDQFFAGMTDINYFRFDDKAYYHVGEIGRGIQGGFTKAGSMHEIRVISDIDDSSENIFDHDPYLLTMMAVPFIKAYGLGVMPFPVKLMREWAIMSSIEIQENMRLDREEDEELLEEESQNNHEEEDDTPNTEETTASTGSVRFVYGEQGVLPFVADRFKHQI